MAEQQDSRQLRVWWRHWSVVFILAVLAALIVWSMLNLGPWLKSWQDQRAASAARKQMEELYRNDKYGGSTPEETFDMFIAALEKGDTELASKYFVLNEQDNWERSLKSVKEQNLLAEMIEELKTAQNSGVKKGNEEIFRLVYEVKIEETRWLDLPDGSKSEFQPGNYGAEIVFENFLGKWKISKI